jgi:transposase
MENEPEGMTRAVIGGVDTHKDTHVAAVIDLVGRLLGTHSFPTTAAGYRALLRWMCTLGAPVRIGVEGTSSYGAGLTRALRTAGVAVVEVNRPNRQLRRQRGKSDAIDAEAAARAALAQHAPRIPKAQDGTVEVLRLLRLQRRSALHARTQAGNQLHAVVASAPESIRLHLRDQSLVRLVATLHRQRPRKSDPPLEAMTRAVLHGLARRWRQLDEEIRTLTMQLEPLVRECAPALLDRPGVGPEVAAALLVAAGDNPERLRNERSFAALCGVSPIDASSGRQRRHRLNRGGNRDANRALWVIAFVRWRMDPATKTYAARRMAEGRTKLEVMRCLKRYIAREIFTLLQPLHHAWSEERLDHAA